MRCIGLLALAPLLTSVCLPGAAAAQTAAVKTAGVRMEVADLDESVDFYVSTLKCEIEALIPQAGLAVLRSGPVQMVLSASGQAMPDDASASRVTLDFIAASMDEPLQQLRKRSVTLTTQDNGGGEESWLFRGPSGERLSLRVERRGEAQPDYSVMLRSVAIETPDLEKASGFYAGLLNVESASIKRIRRFTDVGTIAFTLRESPELGRAVVAFGETPFAGLVFEVADIESAMARVQRGGGALIDKTPMRGQGLLYAFFADPFGNIHELTQHGDFDP